MKLAETLARVDALLAASNPETHETLAPGAKKSALTKLSKAVFAGKAVPEAIATLFSWHDGQTKPASLHPKNNRSLMSVDEAIDARKFLSDPKEEILQPWSKSWLPVFANGAGDYVCVETAGKQRGSLIAYWHADEDRDVEFPSLEAWADDLARALEKAPRATGTSAKGTLTFDATSTSWSKAKKRPSKSDVAKAHVGTVFWFRKEFAMNLERKLVCLFVKVADGGKTWRHAKAVRSAGSALAHIEEIDARKKKPDDYEWMSDDVDVASECEDMAVMTGAVRVAQRVRPPRDVDVSKLSLTASGPWKHTPADAIRAETDAVGTAYRAVAPSKRGPQARVYVKVATDVWIGAVTPVDTDAIAELVPRLREKTKYPRYQILRDMEVAGAVEFDLDGADDLTRASVVLR